MSGAKFNGADIQGANFKNVNLKNAEFKGVTAGLPKYWALFMSLLLLIVSIIVTFLALTLFTFLWGTPSLPPAAKFTYSIISIIAVPTFIGLILRQGIIPAFLILIGLISTATFVINFPNLVIFMSIVTAVSFLIIGWRMLANSFIILTVLIFGNYWLPSILNFVRNAWEQLGLSVSFIVFFERLGTSFSIAVAELIITTISITTL